MPVPIRPYVCLSCLYFYLYEVMHLCHKRMCKAPACEGLPGDFIRSSRRFDQNHKVSPVLRWRLLLAPEHLKFPMSHMSGIGGWIHCRKSVAVSEFGGGAQIGGSQIWFKSLLANNFRSAIITTGLPSRDCEIPAKFVFVSRESISWREVVFSSTRFVCWGSISLVRCWYQTKTTVTTE